MRLQQLQPSQRTTASTTLWFRCESPEDPVQRSGHTDCGLVQTQLDDRQRERAVRLVELRAGRDQSILAGQAVRELGFIKALTRPILSGLPFDDVADIWGVAREFSSRNQVALSVLCQSIIWVSHMR